MIRRGSRPRHHRRWWRESDVTFQAQVVSPLPAGVSQVVTQGTITCGNAAAIVTDDPTTPEANDATRTAVVARPLHLWK